MFKQSYLYDCIGVGITILVVTMEAFRIILVGNKINKNKTQVLFVNVKML